MKKVERLIQRLRDELHLDIPGDSVFRRVYAGHCQRAEGAWSWCIQRKAPNGLSMAEIGSPLSVTELLKCKTFATYTDHRNLSGDIDIFPGKSTVIKSAVLRLLNQLQECRYD